MSSSPFHLLPNLPTLISTRSTPPTDPLAPAAAVLVADSAHNLLAPPDTLLAQIDHTLASAEVEVQGAAEGVHNLAARSGPTGSAVAAAGAADPMAAAVDVV